MIAKMEPTKYAKKPHARIIQNVVKIISIGEAGNTSPYPTVVIVVNAQDVVMTYKSIGSSI